jgi:hypothetical protein
MWFRSYLKTCSMAVTVLLSPQEGGACLHSVQHCACNHTLALPHRDCWRKQKNCSHWLSNWQWVKTRTVWRIRLKWPPWSASFHSGPQAVQHKKLDKTNWRGRRCSKGEASSTLRSRGSFWLTSDESFVSGWTAPWLQVARNWRQVPAGGDGGILKGVWPV